MRTPPVGTRLRMSARIASGRATSGCQIALEVHDGVVISFKALAGVVHHYLDEDRYKKAHDRRAASNLIAVDATVPGRTTV